MKATFIRCVATDNKAEILLNSIRQVRSNESCPDVYSVDPEDFNKIPGSPFSYWLGPDGLDAFNRLPYPGDQGITARQGLGTADDFRFVRCWWEVHSSNIWKPYAKGGKSTPHYCDLHLVVNWRKSGEEIKSNTDAQGKVKSNIWMLEGTARDYFFREGLTWASRPHNRGTFCVVPAGAIFSVSGMMLFSDSREKLLSISAILNSTPYINLLHSIMPRGGDGSGQTLKYEIIYLFSVPVPIVSKEQQTIFDDLVRKSWRVARSLDAIQETSHSFYSPSAIRSKLGMPSNRELGDSLQAIQNKIDVISYELYGLSDGKIVQMDLPDNDPEDSDLENEFAESGEARNIDDLLSWCVGIAFGRFDWRLATGEREAPSEPDLFDPLPAKSPGMLPDGAEPFHAHAGILVDDQGHQQDLAHLIEEVLARVDIAAPDDVRRWLQRDFFAFHLQRYSKSRRKAPIYWPLSTTSGGYTLWVYYPSLTSQTLYTAINDFVEPKLKQVGGDVTALRNKGSTRTRDDEKQFETLQAFELELIELRDTLLKLAPAYKPNHDDGVQISAAPLWPLFRHKPWQKVLKDTWTKLEKGDYDWAHLAMNYWPERVREKCKTDKSLAIAHGLEDLYIEPEAAPKKARKKKAGGDE